MIFHVIYFLFCIVTNLEADPSSTLSPCQKDDEVCYTKNANTMYKVTIHGESAWGIPSLDPMTQNHIEGNFGNIYYKLWDSGVDGFKTCNVQRASFNLQKSAVGFDILCPWLAMHGFYEIKGHLLGLPIEGNGKYMVEYEGCYLKVNTGVKFTKQEDGKRYISFKKFSATGKIQDKVRANLTNLFNGNDALAKPMLKFINDHGKLIAEQLHDPVLYENVKKIFKNMNKLMSHVPFELIVVE